MSTNDHRIPRSLLRMRIIHSRRHANHNALATSICEPYIGFEVVWWNALKKENNVWVTVPFEGSMIEFGTNKFKFANGRFS